jgi:23S rRNA pseudouridine2457 synthase
MILFENDYYLIVNKPSGLPIHSTLDKTRVNLFDSLRKKYGNELFLIHRLDADTSGVVLFSKKAEANKILDSLFKTREIKKTYFALVVGELIPTKGTMEDFLERKKINGIEKMIKVSKGGEKAITDFEVIEKKGLFSLVKLSIQTGRMHQIRAQLSLRGAPIFSDKFYGREIKHERLRLHSFSLSFIDPFSQEKINVTAPLPDNFFPQDKRYIKFYKPFDVLSQFTPEDGARSLSEFNLPSGVYAAGRLDKDSEGLLLLTDDGPFIEKMLNPKSHEEKTYWVQVEGIPTSEAIRKLCQGVQIQDYFTRPAKVKLLQEEPKLHPRNPPIRERKNIPTSWLEIKIVEGKNRQVRRMTATVGFPTLRLVRVAIGEIRLDDLAPGEFKDISHEFQKTK